MNMPNCTSASKNQSCAPKQEQGANSIEISKKLHAQKEAGLQYWKGAFDDSNDDTRRHFAILDTALPILQQVRPKTLLSIGDSRGREAAYFKKKLNIRTIASDLDTSKLSPAVADGFIDECRRIDVEDIDMESDSVDVVITKESFHHWPRPMLGLYEMIRVAKLGVLLIEPNDCCSIPQSNQFPTTESYRDSYESVGNYKYQISAREILKSAWAMGLKAVIVRGTNDPFRPGKVFDDWKIERDRLDLLGFEGKRQFNLLTIYIHKNGALGDIQLPKHYALHHRPVNPHSPLELGNESI